MLFGAYVATHGDIAPGVSRMMIVVEIEILRGRFFRLSKRRTREREEQQVPKPAKEIDPCLCLQITRETTNLCSLVLRLVPGGLRDEAAAFLRRGLGGVLFRPGAAAQRPRLRDRR